MKYGKIGILYTGGTFDLFHAGHVRFLMHCRKIAESVVVCLNTDDFIERFKGAVPVISYEEREQVLLSCQYVDKVIPNTGGEDSKPTILQSGAAIIAIGSDWAAKDYYKQMDFTQEWLDKNGITLVYISFKRVQSTTNIKKQME